MTSEAVTWTMASAGAGLPLVSLVIFLPLLGALLLAVLPRESRGLFGAAASFVAAIDLMLALALFAQYEPGRSGMQMIERVAWLPRLGIEYYVAIDGISLALVLLTCLLGLVTILFAWCSVTRSLRQHLVLLLALQTGLLGVFCALDLFLFFVFWEAGLIPMYLLIGKWGGPQRIYATVKFVLYTMLGSAVMLAGILALAAMNREAGSGPTFDLLRLIETPVPPGAQTWLFISFVLAFAIKIPLFPFHTWLPDAHVESPTSGSVILAGVLLKLGAYGLLRVAVPLYPDAAHRLLPMLAVLALIGIIYGALVAFAQRDIKSLVAYSSVSHMGLIVVGLASLSAIGWSGAVLHMVNHGLATGALFLVVGMIYDRRHTRRMDELGGLWRPMPVLGAFFLIVVLSSIGLPGLSGFVGEWLILLGAFEVRAGVAAVAATGLVLGAAYMLWMFQRVMYGPLSVDNAGVRDLAAREILVLLPLVVSIIWIGVYPTTLLDPVQRSAAAWLAQVAAGPR
jgi:NADH-quinone oxidoreductase subunit M